jgi:2,5-dichlorohydroquinone reductive dechlorinase
MKPSLEAAVADVQSALGRKGEIVGRGTPRFELFHAPNSICSQKVRTVLAHHGTPYVSHSMDLFAGQTYLPAYVRLRMIGCDRLGGPLVSAHMGSTSVSAGGCDPAVVPTLVDRETGEVLVDSKRICLCLDELAGSPLRPAKLAAKIDAEIAVVDNLPNYQMLSGRPPGEDRRPPSQRGKTGVDFATSKVARCDRYLAEFAGDDVLVRAYSAKRAKEQMAADTLFSAEAMRSAYDKAEAACDSLDRALANRRTRWLLDDEVTLADIYWALEFVRMKNLGAQGFWAAGARPALASYAERAEALPAVRSAVIDWPGALF